MTSGQVVGALDIGGTHVTAGRVHIESRAVEAGTRVRVPFPPDAGSEVNRVVEAAAAIARPELRQFGAAAR